MDWLHEHGYEDAFYIYPTYYSKHKKKRVYISLYTSGDVSEMRLGYINAVTLLYVPETSWSMHFDAIGLADWLESRKEALVNIAKYGIEGCLIKHIDKHPCKTMLQDMRSTIEIERDTIENYITVNLQWKFIADNRSLSHLMLLVLRKMTEKNLDHTYSFSTGLTATILILLHDSIVTDDEIRSLLQ